MSFMTKKVIRNTFINSFGTSIKSNSFAFKFKQYHGIPRQYNCIRPWNPNRPLSPLDLLKSLIYRGCLLIHFKGDTHSFTTQSWQYHTSLVASIIFNNLSLHFYTTDQNIKINILNIIFKNKVPHWPSPIWICKMMICSFHVKFIGLPDSVLTKLQLTSTVS